MSGGIGTVLVWYEAFEKTRNSEMAEMFPEFAEFFDEVNDHTFDLMKIFPTSSISIPNSRVAALSKKYFRFWSPSYLIESSAFKRG